MSITAVVCDSACTTGKWETPFRRSLKMVVCAIIREVGFTSADDDALETLTEMLQSLITELARSSKAFAELSGRTHPLVGDIVLALIEMGINIDTIGAYGRRQNAVHIPPPQVVPAANDSRRLQVGIKRPHPPHIPDYMPPFPDPHAYIKSVTYRPPVTEYQVVRERVSAEKRDIERALTRFIAKTGDTENLFPDDPYAFPLIANKMKPLPYLEALLPKDEELEELDDDEKRLTQQQQQPEAQTKSDSLQTPTSSSSAATQLPKSELSTSLDAYDSENLIDNPYLRPIVMPKLKIGSKKSR